MKKRFLDWWYRWTRQTANRTPTNRQVLISGVSHEGFTLEPLMGKRQKSYRWSNFSWIQINLIDRALSFHGEDGIVFTLLEKDHVGWFALVHGIPKWFPGYEANVIDEFHAGLSYCYVCGAKAVEDDVCLACHTKAYSGGPLQQEYHRIRQLEYFAQQAAQPYSQNLSEGLDGFPMNPDYERLVTKEELWQYMKANATKK